MDEQIRAVIYAPPGLDTARWRRDCRDHCASRGYEIVAIAHQPAAVEAMWRDRRMELVVVARPEHLRSLAYAVEVVTEELDRRAPRRRRTSRLTWRDRGSP